MIVTPFVGLEFRASEPIEIKSLRLMLPLIVIFIVGKCDVVVQVLLPSSDQTQLISNPMMVAVSAFIDGLSALRILCGDRLLFWLVSSPRSYLFVVCINMICRAHRPLQCRLRLLAKDCCWRHRLHVLVRQAAGSSRLATGVCAAIVKRCSTARASLLVEQPSGCPPAPAMRPLMPACAAARCHRGAMACAGSRFDALHQHALGRPAGSAEAASRCPPLEQLAAMRQPWGLQLSGRQLGHARQQPHRGVSAFWLTMPLHCTALT